MPFCRCLSHSSCDKIFFRILFFVQCSIFATSIYISSICLLPSFLLDLQDSDQPWKHAIDLVRAIKKINANISVVVAGYPEVHSEATDRTTDLKFLKEKVDAGAGCIVTNVCFSFPALADFIRSCREIGITAPIVPGIFVPSSYATLVQMCKICKVKVPEDQLAVYRSLKNQEVEFREFAVSNAVKFINQLLNNEYERTYGIHFFTLNKYENVYEVIKRLNFE